MIHSPLTHLAFAIAHMAHAGQLDKAGERYIEHPIAVAEKMPDEFSTAVALLHDVMEDNPEFNAKTLLLYGIPADVVEQVDYLTRKPGQSYMDYICSLRDKPVARMVKLADLEHNCDLSRYPVVPIDAYGLRNRYLKAIKVLNSPDHLPKEA